MILYRKAIIELEKWKKSDFRKPLLLRGARQVGKSFIAKEFSKTYAQRITLNLEKQEDFNLFDIRNSLGLPFRVLPSVQVSPCVWSFDTQTI
jgi:predicted AAA+ superfamily ATPase